MPIQVSIDEESSLITLVLDGPASADETVDCMMRLSEADPGKKLRMLLDVRKHEIHWEIGQVRRFAGVISDSGRLFADRVAAVVVARTVQFGIVRMFHAYVHRSAISLEIFYDIDEARQWLATFEPHRPGHD